MDLLDKASDSILKKVTKMETIRISYEQLAELVNDEFIKGADDDFLQKVQKTAKGGGLITVKNLNSASGRYTLHVGNRDNGYIFGTRKQTYIFDNTENKFYQLDKDGKWKKFYNAVCDKIQIERINRSR